MFLEIITFQTSLV